MERKIEDVKVLSHTMQMVKEVDLKLIDKVAFKQEHIFKVDMEIKKKKKEDVISLFNSEESHLFNP